MVRQLFGNDALPPGLKSLRFSSGKSSLFLPCLHPAAPLEAAQVGTMGKIEWAMWANEQALASGLSEYLFALNKVNI